MALTIAEIAKQRYELWSFKIDMLVASNELKLSQTVSSAKLTSIDFYLAHMGTKVFNHKWWLNKVPKLVSIEQ